MLNALLDLERRGKAGDVAAQIRLGLLCEKSGRLEEGMNWLALAARGGDAEALALVGVRLISGPFSPQIAARGAELLAEAAERGSAEGAARLAVLHAAGVFVRKDWARALELLRAAAALGSREARAELAILARGPGAGGARASREDVDIQAWTSARHMQTLCADPLVRTGEAFASAQACAWIIRQAYPRLAKAQVYDPASGLTTLSAERTNRAASFGLAETGLVILALQEALAASLGAELASSEAGSVLCYAPGEEAREHFDFLDPQVPAYARDIAAQGQRIATGLVYLSDSYAGGTTDFPLLGLSHRPRTGAALLFSNVTAQGTPDLRTRHAGRPPLRGTKWVLSCFIRSRPRLPG